MRETPRAIIWGRGVQNVSEADFTGASAVQKRSGLIAHTFRHCAGTAPGKPVTCFTTLIVAGCITDSDEADS